MKTLTTTLFILLFLQLQNLSAETMPYQDSEFGCFNKADADRYVTDFHINVKSFGGLELCDSKIDTKKLLNDMRIVENGRFTSSQPNNLIKNFVNPDQYYPWLKQQTRGIERGNDVPYATAYNSGGFFTMQDGWAKLSTLGRVGTVVHEARHTEGYQHIVCTQGTYQDTRVLGCDRNYSYGGSHAVEMEYYARVAVQGVNFHPVYKKMARLMAMARSNIFFNTTPLQTREGLVALSMDQKKSYLYDQGRWVEREMPDLIGKLKRTSYGAVLFDGLKAWAIEMYENSGSTEPVVDTYSYYKLLAENTQGVKGFEEFDAGSKRFVVQLTKDNTLAAYDFPNGTWGRGQQVPFEVVKTSTAIPGQVQAGFYVINQAGQIYSYQPQTQRLVSQIGTWDFENKEVVSFQNQNLILKTNGQIYVQSSQSLMPWPESTMSFSDLVTVPLYDSFEVVKQ